MNAVRIEHDGFEGDVIGSYVTREGKRGAVVQQTGTRVVHVYLGDYRPTPAADVAELVERLRTLALQIDPCLLGGPDARLLNEAADRLAAMSHRVGELTQYTEHLEASELAGVEKARDLLRRAEAAEAKLAEAGKALEHARHLMWEYGFSENDLQPIRTALSTISTKGDAG